jgi:hypothetical protein
VFEASSALATGIGAKKSVPFGPGTLRDDTFTFGCLLFGTIEIIGALLFFSVAAIGPLAEHLAESLFGGSSEMISNCKMILWSAMSSCRLSSKRWRIYTFILLARLVRY